MMSTLTTGADLRLDKKLDHVLEEFILARGGNHEIRQVFKEEELINFKEFVTYELEHIQDMRRKQGNAMKSLNNLKVRMIYNVIRYYQFLRSDPQSTILAEEPENWVKEDFKLWRDLGRHPTVASANAASSGTITNATWKQEKQAGTANTSMIGLDSSLEYVASNWLQYTNVRLLIEDNNIKTFGEFVNIDNHKVVKSMGYYSYKYPLLLQYIEYIKDNGDCDLAEYPEPWDNKHFDAWQVQRYLKRRSIDLMARTTPTTVVVSTEIVLNEEETAPEIHADIASNKVDISNVNAANDDDNDTVATTTTTTVVSRTKNNSKEEATVPKNVSSKLNSIPVATDDVVDDDNTNNAKSPPECENSIGDLDGIKDEFYQADGKYCPVYDRSNDDNPPPLPPELPASAIDIQCIHSNIPNDGEILSLPLISSVYRVKQPDQMENNGLHDSPKAVTDFPTYEINSNPGFWDDVDDDDEVNNPIFYSSMETPTAAPERVSNERVISNLSIAVADDDDDDIDNAKSPPECENSIGDLDDIQDEYYQRKGNNDDYEYSNEDVSSNLIVVATDDGEIDNSNIHSNTVAVPTTTTTTASEIRVDMLSKEDDISNIPVIRKLVTNEEVNSNANVGTKEDDSSNNSTNDVATAVTKEDEDSPVSVSVSVSVPVPITTSPTTTTALVSNEDIISNTAAADAEEDVDNAKFLFECKNSIGNLDGIKGEYYQVKGNNKNDDADVRYDGVPVDNYNYGVIYDRSDTVNPPPLPPESLDDDVWNLERDRSNDDNNSFNYVDIEKEILQSNHEDLTGEYETIVFSHGDDILNVSDDASSPPPPEHHEDSIGILNANRQDKCRTLAVLITTTAKAPEIVSNEPVISNRIRTENVSNEAVSSNLNDATAAVATAADLYANGLATTDPGVVPNGNANSVLIADDDDDDDNNPPPLPPEPNLPCMHSIIRDVNTKLEWTLKKYLVDNDNTHNTELNENATVFRSVFQAVSVMYQLLFRHALIVVVFESVHQINTADTDASCNGLYDGEQRLHYFVNSNNGEIPEDELNYQTSNINSIEATSTMKWKILVRRLISDMNDEYHEETNVVVQVIIPNDRVGKDSDVQVRVVKNNNSFSDYDDGNDNDDTHGFTIINYDINSDDNNEYNRDTFHDSIQAEDMIDDTYNDDDDVNRKPINNVIDHGEQHLILHTSGCSDNYEDGYVNITSANEVECLEWYMQKYQVDKDTKLDWVLKWYRVDNVYEYKYGNTKLEWSLKKWRVNNIKFDQKKELKRCDHTDATKEDQGYSMPDLLDHLDSISLQQDPYSNKQWNQQSKCRDIPDSIDSQSYDDPRVCTCCYGEHYILFNTNHFKEEMKSNRCDHDILCSNQEPLKRAHSPEGMLSCPNSDPLRHTHSPQGMLSLIDPTGGYVMKRKDEECYRRYIGKPLGEMDYVWGDNESISNSPTVPEAKLYKQQQWSYQSSYHELIYPTFHQAGNTAALFLDDTFEVDVSIAEGSIFGILGSEKLSNYCYILAVKQSEKPMNGMHVCGQAIVETSIYTTIRRLIPVQ